MARRKRKKKSSSFSPIPVIAGALAVLILLVGVYWFSTSGNRDSKYPILPAKEMQNNPSSLSGSNFSVIAKVKSKLFNSESKGTLIDIEVKQDGETYRLPILVPNGINSSNLSVEQNYIFNGKVSSRKRFIVSSYNDK